jgi:FKBP-type peptidyl-prolyl cis-trans isomerase (trigger factor)
MSAEKGVKVLEERIGDGPIVEKHDTCDFDLQISLSREDVVFPREHWEHRIGRRMIIAGIEKALLGMRVGGYRKVRVSPHLAYGSKGVEGKIPPNAVLTCEFWLNKVTKPSPVAPSN